ncbi:MAG: glycerate kinase family protein [Fusobacteriaceae bacterium]
MKVLIAIDSFKGSLTSLEAAESFECGVKKIYPNAEVVKVSLADGGEGTVQALVTDSCGEIVEIEVNDPLMRKIKSFYGILGNKKTAIIEMAAASGLPLLTSEEKNPMETSTFGTGELIKDAIQKGCREFIVGIGGSATNDGGIGMLKAFGYKFLDKNNEELKPIGKNLIKIVKIDTSKKMKELDECNFLIACDVDNPLYGPKGAAEIYSRQKGATEEMVKELDLGLKNFSNILKNNLSKDIGAVPGSGAAGGLGAGFLGFLNAELKSGIEIIVETIKLKEKMKNADLVITGEGRIDFQTIMGKTPVGVSKVAKSLGIPVIAVAGSVGGDSEEVHKYGIDAVFSIMNSPISLKEAMVKDNAKKMMEKNAMEIMRVIKAFKGDSL